MFLQEKENVFEKLWSYINHQFKFGNFEISVTSLALGIGVLFIAVIASRGLRNFLDRRFERHPNIDQGLRFTLLRLTHYIIFGAGLLFAFRLAFNADLTTLAVLFTALSVGIGFGLQFIAGDLAAGFILLFERPVRVGDFIKAGESEGKPIEGLVKSINLRTTVVLTNDGIAVIVPNSKLTNQNLINWTYENRRARISVPIGVAYDSDVNLVRETLLRAAKGVKFVLEEPAPSVQFLQFGDSSLNFRLLVWTDRPRRYPQIKSEINYRIHQMFNDANIEIPFPQQELRLRDVPSSLDPNKAVEFIEKDESDAELVHR
ncbi:MAG: mechanosensitive ion channel [Pyrinomonadaceae bacterium]